MWSSFHDIRKSNHYAVHRKLISAVCQSYLNKTGWKKIFHANENQKKAGVAILISDKIDFKIKNVTRDKEGYYMMIKGSIQEEDITIINIYSPNMEYINT